MNPAMRTVVLDDELAQILERDKPLEQAARESLVMDLFRREKISAGKACALLGLERLKFVQRAAELAIPVHLTNEEEWAADLATLASWREKR